MKSEIILSGVGGQGILSIASVIGLAAVKNNLFLKQSEIHGMSQRGGSVQAHLRISDKQIFSDLIPEGEANLILSLEPMESLRYLPWLSNDGWLITNSAPFININDYPPVEEITNEIRKIKNHLIIDADAIAKEAGSHRSGNMVLLGAASSFIDIPLKSLINGVVNLFGRKGEEVVKVNLAAFKAGIDISKNKRLF